MSNQLRAIASDIVSTCQTEDNAKRVKQSTVLKVLTRSLGYRSIQASDAATGTKKENRLTCDVVALRGVLYANYPHSDLLPIELGELISRTAPLENDQEIVGDRLFVCLWDTVSEHGMACVDQLESFLTLTEEMEEALETRSDLISVDDRYPQILLNFINSEIREAHDDGCSYERNYSASINAIAKVQRDIEAVLEAVRLARFHQDA